MSKGLEALKSIWLYIDEPTKRQFALQDYKIIEKELKALEIIKEKEVNVFIFLHSGDLETYNDMVEDNRKLNQKEYKLLKEVLTLRKYIRTYNINSNERR